MGIYRTAAAATRRAGLLLAILLAAAGQDRATPAHDDGFRPTAYANVNARSLPLAAPAGGVGQIYVKPGATPVTRTPAPPVRLVPVPAPGGGEMVFIPPSLYPAATAVKGPDGQVRVVCDDDGDHAGHEHGLEVTR